MASTDLLFGQLPNPPGGPVEIVFGDDDTGLPPGVVELLASGALTGLRGHIVARVVAKLRAAGSITGLRGRIGALYDVNVARPVASTVRSGWQEAQPLRVSTQVRYEQARPVHAPVQVAWQDGRSLGAVHQSRWQQAQPLQALVRQYQQQAQSVGSAPTLQRFEDAARLRSIVLQRMQQALPVAAPPTAQRFEDATHLRHLVRSSFEQGQHLQAAARDGFGRAVPLSRVIAVRYQEARKPPPGISKPVQPPAVDPCYVASQPVNLVFEELVDSSQPVNLVFVCERHGPGPQPVETIVVPVRRVYVVINEARLRRVDGDIQIPTFTMSMSLDADSWTWSFSASVPGYALADIEPEDGVPVAVQATINGVPYRFVVESIARERTFGRSDLRIGGRGRAAVLDAPYAPIMSFRNTGARTAQQIMIDILTDNGVPLGWDVEWNPDDWNVPAGVFNHQGSYISALNQVAGSISAYLQPHNTDEVLRVLSRYPVAPWDWAGVTPDFDLPAAVMSRESIEWRDKPRYNRVYVMGQQAGVNGRVTRAGTAGDYLAPSVVDPLITQAVAARQRGIAVLSDTGRIATVGLRLPVLAETGIIKPGSFISYIDGGIERIGLTRSVQVEVGLPAIWQTLGVETHVEPV